jgi:hypothetical protein
VDFAHLVAAASIAAASMSDPTVIHFLRDHEVQLFRSTEGKNKKYDTLLYSFGVCVESRISSNSLNDRWIGQADGRTNETRKTTTLHTNRRPR